MQNADIANTLSLMSELLELKGENPFKVRAFQNAARAVKGLTGVDLEGVTREKRLTTIPGIGKGIAEVITELFETGRIAALDALRAEMPTEFTDMVRIPGLGPKKIKQLHDDLGIDTLRELEYALIENRLLDLPGFGAKTQEKIRQGLSFVLANRGRYLISDALPTALALRQALQDALGLTVTLAGDLRRQRSVVEEIVLLIEAGETRDTLSVATLADVLQRTLGTVEVDRASPTRIRIQPAQGPRVQLEIVDSDAFPAALCILTGSSAHVEALRLRAEERHLRLTDQGLFKLEPGSAPEATAGKPVTLADEAALYTKLGLAWIPPELRENQGEIEAAQSPALPSLIGRDELRGVFHVHTTWSDGNASVRDMAAAAATHGLAYLGISDHSKAASYAGGLDETRLLQQAEEIDAYNLEVAAHGKGPWVFKGSEVDILADGRLDLDDEALERLDFVIASVHSHFSQSETEVTARVLRAIAHPKVTILGHPTGRLLLGRSGYPVDLEVVLQAAAKRGTVMEINANPHRQDLDWRWVKRGRELGVRFAINPDAHSPRGFADLSYGIGNARRGWLSGQDVINTQNLASMKQWLQDRREARDV